MGDNVGPSTESVFGIPFTLPSPRATRSAATFKSLTSPANDMQRDLIPLLLPHWLLQRIALMKDAAQDNCPPASEAINETLIRMYSGIQHSKLEITYL